MKLPAAIHGPYAACRRRASRAVAAILRGGVLREAFERDGWVDTSEGEGLLVLHGPNPLLADDPHYQVYLPLSALLEAVTARKLAAADMEPLFQQALGTEWGLLSLVAIPNVIWTYPPHRHLLFLRALIPHWTTFVDEGARYTAGSSSGADLWTHADTLKGVLVRDGISLEELQERPSQQRLAELVQRIERTGAPSRGPIG